MLWPHIFLKACVAASSLAATVCQEVYLPVNIEDQGLLSPAAASLTCQMKFFEAVTTWEMQHPGWRVQESGCVNVDPLKIARKT